TCDELGPDAPRIFAGVGQGGGVPAEIADKVAELDLEPPLAALDDQHLAARLLLACNGGLRTRPNAAKKKRDRRVRTVGVVVGGIGAVCLGLWGGWIALGRDRKEQVRELPLVKALLGMLRGAPRLAAAKAEE
ncbi:hypothetical protein TeGR_g197, partial [Tetraparma gracilis]